MITLATIITSYGRDSAERLTDKKNGDQYHKGLFARHLQQPYRQRGPPIIMPAA